MITSFREIRPRTNEEILEKSDRPLPEAYWKFEGEGLALLGEIGKALNTTATNLERVFWLAAEGETLPQREFADTAEALELIAHELRALIKLELGASYEAMCKKVFEHYGAEDRLSRFLECCADNIKEVNRALVSKDPDEEKGKPGFNFRWSFEKLLGIIDELIEGGYFSKRDAEIGRYEIVWSASEEVDNCWDPEEEEEEE